MTRTSEAWPWFHPDTEKYANRFDFSGLRGFTTTGLRIIHAGEHFHATRVTALGTKHFFLLKRDHKFRLHSQTSELGEVSIDRCNDANLLIVSDDLGRVLRLLGYDT